MALTDFYELRDFQIAGSQAILNVYHYIRGVGVPSALTVGTAYIETVLPLLTPIQSATVSRTVVEVENLGDPFDFATIDTSGSPGTLAGAALTTLAAATIQLNRTRNDIKNGMKRFYVGAEASVLTNFWEAAFLTSLQLLADKLVVPIEVAASPGVSQGHLVILKRFCTVLPSPPCTGVYRLPNTDMEVDDFNYQPISATARATVRSQVSRKRLV